MARVFPRVPVRGPPSVWIPAFAGMTGVGVAEATGWRSDARRIPACAGMTAAGVVSGWIPTFAGMIE